MTIETLERAKDIQRELHECSKSMAVFDKMLANDYFGDELVAVTFVRGFYMNEVRNGHTLRVEQDQVRAFLIGQSTANVLHELDKRITKRVQTTTHEQRQKTYLKEQVSSVEDFIMKEVTAAMKKTIDEHFNAI